MSHGRFVPTDVLSGGHFVATDILTPRMFCPYGRYVHGRSVSGRFVSGRFVWAPYNSIIYALNTVKLKRPLFEMFIVFYPFTLS
jgi:hypothetical protein